MKKAVGLVLFSYFCTIEPEAAFPLMTPSVFVAMPHSFYVTTKSQIY